MTCLEKLKKDYQNGWFKRMTCDCPDHYGYMDKPRFPDELKCHISCNECWEREIPESVDPVAETEFRAPKVIEESSTIVHRCEPGKPDLELKVERKTMLGTEDMYINTETLPVAKILDSGNRRQFESGAVRDIQEGKGRCDLLPLDVVAEYYSIFYERDNLTSEVFHYISEFVNTGAVSNLYEVLNVDQPFDNSFDMFLEVAIHFEEGAKKYGENNWQKGIPVHCYIDSAVRHYLKFLRGDKDEPHDRAFCWNIMCAIWTCKHKPELNEYAVKDG